MDGCDRQAHHGQLCHGHSKRRARGQPLDAPLRERKPQATISDLWRDLTDAALLYADADAEDHSAWTIASIRLRLAAQRYAMRVREDP